MILNFASVGSQDIYDGADSRKARQTLPKDLWETARRKLDQLAAATASKDLEAPPGNHLERLKGSQAGRLSIRINQKYRIVFRFEYGNASEVRIVDYH